MNQAQPPRIDFKQGQKEIRTAEGIPAWEPVDQVIITPFGSAGKDSVTKEYSLWLASIKSQAGNGTMIDGLQASSARFLPEWVKRVEEAYHAWKHNEEIPVAGTALKNWAVIAPHFLQHCLASGIRSVEELASVGDDLITSFGMGGMVLREQARKYVQINGGGANQAAAEIATLKMQLEEREAKLAELSERLAVLEAVKPSKK